MPPGDQLGSADVSVVLTPTRGRAFAPGGYVYVVGLPPASPTPTPELPVSSTTPDNPLIATSPAAGLILVSRKLATSAIPTTMKKPATSTVGKAPKIARHTGELVSLVSPRLPAGVRLTVKAKLDRKYVELGHTVVGPTGLAQLPVFTVTRAATVTLALVNPATGKTTYIKVVVTKTQL
jgi:hypothetical protein